MPGVVTVTIMVDAVRMKPEYGLLSIDIVKEINRISTAQFVLIDGDAAQQKFEISDSDFFKLGKEVEIRLRYEGEADQTAFIGLIVKSSIRANASQSVLTIFLKDPAIKLTQRRKSAIFRNLDDITVIKKIIQTHGLKLGTVTPPKTAVVHPEMVQFYCSDWDFILSRAEANGLWVLVDEGVINVQAPKLIRGKEITLEYGSSEIYDLEIEADIREQFQLVEAMAWDDKTQSLTQPQSGDDYPLKQSHLEPTRLGKIIGADRCQLVPGAELDPKEIQAWASAKLLKHRLSMVKGRMQILGRADLKLGGVLKLQKFGKNFDGTTLITGIRHQIDQGGWCTDIQFGASAMPFAQQDDIMEPPASGLLPAVHGLQIGVVGSQGKDPQGKFRVQVQIPRLTPSSGAPPSDQNNGLVWARLAVLEAGLAGDRGPGRGTFFRPEPGDEVVLGFLNDDPRQAIILGAVYSENHQPPLPVTPENDQRGIFTKEKLKLLFDDRDKSILLETAEKNQILLTDKDGGIQMIDKNNNQFIMNENGIEITSDKDITITAKGNITIRGKQGNITLQGNKVDVQ